MRLNSDCLGAFHIQLIHYFDIVGLFCIMIYDSNIFYINIVKLYYFINITNVFYIEQNK